MQMQTRSFREKQGWRALLAVVLATSAMGGYAPETHALGASEVLDSGGDIILPSDIDSTAGADFLGPLNNIIDIITGPIAVGLTVIGMVVAGGAMIFGRNEMNDFLKGVFNVVMVGALLVFSVNVVTLVFGAPYDPGLTLAYLEATGSALP